MAFHFGRLSAAALACGSALALSGCFLAPGDFESTLNLRADGRFDYSYVGEIHYVAMNDLEDMAEAAENEEFAPTPCYTDASEERPCTEAEIAEQRAEWEARAAQDRQEAQMAAAMMSGGFDLSDPELAKEFAEALEELAGWNEVTPVGDGVFEVDFSISSTIGHTFDFPAIPELPMPNTFVVASPLDGDRVRIDAPGFSPQGGGNPFMAMMGGMAGMMGEMNAEEGAAENPEENMPKLPQPAGTFRIVTNGKILANNTEDGPQETAEGQVLEWEINARTRSAPTALIELDR
jgi:hypothetical protein